MTYDTTFGHDINLNPGRVTPCVVRPDKFTISLNRQSSIRSIGGRGNFFKRMLLVVLISHKSISNLWVIIPADVVIIGPRGHSYH